MSKKPETKFREKVDRLLKTVPNSYFESIQQKSIRGTPDKIGCVAGLFVGLELKADEKSDVTELQRYKIFKFREAGGIAEVVHPGNVSEIIAMLIRLGSRD